MKVVIHSPGMISFDVEGIKPDEASINQVKATNFYRRLVDSFGEERANLLIVEGSERTESFGRDIGAAEM